MRFSEFQQLINTFIFYGPIAQLEEAVPLKGIQCGSESHQDYQTIIVKVNMGERIYTFEVICKNNQYTKVMYSDTVKNACHSFDSTIDVEFEIVKVFEEGIFVTFRKYDEPWHQGDFMISNTELFIFIVYFITAIGAFFVLIEFDKKVNNYSSPQGVILFILGVLSVFWRCILLISFINKSLYSLKNVD